MGWAHTPVEMGWAHTPKVTPAKHTHGIHVTHMDTAHAVMRGAGFSSGVAADSVQVAVYSSGVAADSVQVRDM